MIHSDLLMWKTPVKTGAALAGLNVLALMVMIFDFQLTSLLCDLGMLVVFIGAVIKFVSPEFGKQKIHVMSKEDLQPVVASIAEGMNSATKRTLDTVLWTSQKETVKTICVVEFIRRVIPWVSVTVILFLGVNMMFVVPYTLEAKKDVIDKSLGVHLKKAMDMKDQLLAKVP